MARDFSKNVANYLSLGHNTVGPLLNGFRYLMLSAWVNLDSVDGAANNNRIINVYIDGANTGLMLAVHNGTSAVVRVGCRSQSADGFQTGSGTTVVSTGAWHQVGAIIDIGGDTIQPYLNGVAEGGGSVTFGAATWTDGTPTAGSEDSISGSLAGGVPNVLENQTNGRIAEVGIWASATAFTVADQAAMAARFAPNMVRQDALKVYLPLLGVNSPERDHWGGLSGTITGTVAAADHPNIIYPSGVISVPQAAGGASSSPSTSASSTPSTSPSASPSTSPSASASSSPSTSASSTPSASPSTSVSASPSSSPSATPSESPSTSPSSSPSTSSSPSSSPSASVSASPSSTPSASTSSSPSSSPSPSASVSASPSTSPSGAATTITIEGNVFTREEGGVNVDSNRLISFEMTNAANVTFTFEETRVT